MGTYRVTVLRVAGIPIQIDATWVVIALVLTWSLFLTFAGMYPPPEHPNWTDAVYWGMAGAGAAGLFVCLVLHELGHALVAQRFGVRISAVCGSARCRALSLQHAPDSSRPRRQ